MKRKRSSPISRSAAVRIHRQAWRQSSDGMCVTDSNGVILDCNDAYARLAHFDAGSVIGKPLGECFQDETAATLRTWHKRLTTDLKPHARWTGPLKLKDGTTRMAEVVSTESPSGMAAPCWAHTFYDRTDEQTLQKSSRTVEALFNPLDRRSRRAPATPASSEPVKVDALDRRHVEKALEENERKYTSIIEQFAEGFILVGAKGEILEWNRAMTRISGVSKAECAGLTIWELLDRIVPASRKGPDQIAAMRLMAEQMLLSGVVPEENDVLEFELELPDGIRKYVQQTVFVIQLEEGNRLGLMFQDITQRKEIEIALMDSEQRFRTIVRQSWDVVSVHDRAMNVLYVTPSIEQVLGYAVSGFQAIRVWDIIHPDDRGVAHREMGKVLNKENKGNPTLLRVRCMDGSWKHVEVVATNLLDSPPVNGIVVTFHDVSSRVASEKLLRESEELHRGLISAVPDMILRTDLDGNILYVNETSFPTFGFVPKERILGKNILSFLTPGDLKRASDNMRSMSGHRMGLREYRVKFLDGAELDCEVNGDVLRDDAGVPFGMVYVIRDITERKREEAERKRLEAQLIHAQKIESIGTLAAGIAHDFNNILNIVSGNVNLLVHQPGESNKLARRIDAIEKASERGTQLVKQLLTYARKTKIERQSVMINELIRELAVLLEATFPETIQVQLQCTPHLPSINGDPNQLHQVLLNLSVNARDAMPAGGQLTIRTGSVQGASVREKFAKASAATYVCISIVDVGIGMDEDTLKRIFDPFFTTKGIGRGTGLGMSVVHGIVESHHGFIDVASELGKGTVVTLYLPVVEQVSIESQRSAMDSESIPGGSETILFVEDESLTREFVFDGLTLKGYHVYTSVDGEEALSLFDTHADEIDMVITDIGLPRTNGEKLCRCLLERRSNLPIIVVSGYVDPEKEQSLKTMGVDVVLTKPYKLNGLFASIRKIFDARSAN
ncbi:MAG TPA: PAS domain S-box protein [Bacteroidota bacterium]|nr:PAS domain S-box protein [Bacteroidota bacterium]